MIRFVYEKIPQRSVLTSLEYCLRELRVDDGSDIVEMLREIGPGENGFQNSGHDLSDEEFAGYLQGQVDMAAGVGIDLRTMVPQTRFWLYIDGRPVGIGKLRHYLNDHLKRHGGHIGYTIRPSERGKGYGSLILRELLAAANQIGVKDALLTCGVNNAVSKKVIERNGGELEDIDEGVCRYWIHVE
jgi:predicted acetyltransferase